MIENKKQEETLAMRYFREKYPAFPKGKLIKSESPDFILKTGRHHTTGIELTRLITPAGGFQSPTALIEKLENLIRKKNEKLPLYRKNNFNELWLLITCDDLNLSGNIRLDEVLSDIHLKNGFDKVFLLDLFEGVVYSEGRL
ncbi:MAG: hypothetical protein GXO86_07295 [Chlorobi bacterium]|nr:hypothetical protein [Chlorobiota bacterium]